MATDPGPHDAPTSDAGHEAGREAAGGQGHGGHDGHGEEGEALGPIDRVAWGAALLGLVVAVIVAGALWVATSA